MTRDEIKTLTLKASRELITDMLDPEQVRKRETDQGARAEFALRVFNVRTQLAVVLDEEPKPGLLAEGHAAAEAALHPWRGALPIAPTEGN